MQETQLTHGLTQTQSIVTKKNQKTWNTPPFSQIGVGIQVKF